jgi:hypothetical protein
LPAYRALEYLIAEGEALAYSILKEIPSATSLTYPAFGSGPRAFLGLVESLVKSALRDLDQLRTIASGAAPPQEADLVQESWRANIVLLYAVDLLELTHGATVDDLPFPIIPPSERLLREVQPKSCVIFKSSLEYNYEIESITADGFDELLPKTVLEEFPWPILVVKIPSMPIADTLTHALLAHEIGHVSYGADPPSLDLPEIGEESLRQIAESYLAGIGLTEDTLVRTGQLTLENLLRDEIHTRIRAEIGERISAVVDSWIEELYSDTYGIHLFGPAFFYSYTSFLGSFSEVDYATDDHPPDRLRIQNLITVLNAGNAFSGALSERGREIKAIWKTLIEAETEDASSDDIDSAVRLTAREIVIGVLDQIRAAADSAVLKKYDATAYQDDLKEFVARLETIKVPPIERDELKPDMEQGIPLASILNVGWEALLGIYAQTGANMQPESRTEDRRKLNERILRAIELAEIRRAWELADGDSVR